MKIKKSGWAGRAKVAIVLSAVVLFGLIIVQCNSTIEEQVSIKPDLTSAQVFSNEMNLPILPATGYLFKGDLTNSLDFNIADNKLTINEVHQEVEEIASVIGKSGVTEKGIIVMRVDRDQIMHFVRDVHMEVRKANRLKILYVGQTAKNERVDMAFRLPPSLEYNAKLEKPLPTIDDKYIAETGIDILEIYLGENAGLKNQKIVYDFVQGHMKKQSSNYVVSAKYEDHDTYNDYLTNLTYIQEGFNQIYQERTQKMFGKNFYDLDKKNETEKEQYDAVRKGIPRAISVAEHKRD